MPLRKPTILCAAILSIACAAHSRAGDECSADLDGDFDVDSTDLNILLLGFGCDAGGPGGTCFGDVNGDGRTDSTDLNAILAEFGLACGLGCGSFIAGDCCAPHDTPFCNLASCCLTVCGADPFCCEAVWDESCEAAADATCPSCIPQGACCLSRGGCIVISEDLCAIFSGVFGGEDVPCSAVSCDPIPSCGEVAAGPCCAESSTPNCNNAECCTLVCSIDPFCCEDHWDSACADQAIAACGHCASTTRWFVDYQNGSDDADGLSWETAFATNARLQASLDDYDVAYFRGEFRADDDSAFSNLTGVALIGDPGHDHDGLGNAWIGRQSMDTDPELWELLPGGISRQQIGAGRTVVGVVQDWDDTTLASLGFPDTHAGHLPPAGSAALLDGDWHYDAASGILTVRTWQRDHPAGHAIEYLLESHAITLWNCFDCTLRNFCGKLATKFGNGDGGYGIKGSNTMHCTIEQCVVYDSGDHCVGMAGAKSVNNELRDIRAYGQAHDPLGSRPSIMYVFAGFDVDGGGDRAIDCAGSPTPLLTPGLTPVRDALEWRGSFGISHGGTTTKQTDTEWRACTYDCRALNAIKTDGWDIAQNRQAFVSGPAGGPGFNPADPATYPVKSIDSRIIDAFQLGGGGAVAHTRLGASIRGSLITSSVTGLAAINSKCFLHFEYCTLIASVDAADATDANAFLDYKSNVDVEIRAYNSLFTIETDSTFNTSLEKRDGAFFSGGGPALLLADRCIFLRTGGADPVAAPHFVWLANKPKPGVHLFFSDNWYAARSDADAPARFCEAPFAPGVVNGANAPLESRSDWRTFVDPTAVFDINPDPIGGWPIPNLDPALSEPSPLSPLHEPRFKLAPRPGATGYNGLPDDGTIGPWQYGG